MRRDSKNFRVRARVERAAPHEYVVLVTIEPDDPQSDSAPSVETFKARTREEAIQKQYEMIRAISALLRSRGHHVVDVQTDF
jgi:hypothetical protein